MIDLDKLLPKWNCPNCGDWFHMPYKHCMCDFRKMEKELKFSRKVVEAAREKLVIIYGPELQAEQPCKLLKALKELDGGK